MPPDTNITDFIDIGAAGLLGWLLVRAWAENQRLTGELTKLAQTTVQMLERVDQGLKRLEEGQLANLEAAVKEKNDLILKLLDKIQDLTGPAPRTPRRTPTKGE